MERNPQTSLAFEPFTPAERELFEQLGERRLPVDGDIDRLVEDLFPHA